MASAPENSEAQLAKLVASGWLTQRQSNRIATMLRGGGTLEDALTSLPVLATKDLKPAFSGMSANQAIANSSAAIPKLSREALFGPPSDPKPIPPPAQQEPVELDSELMFEDDQDRVATGEYEALTETASGEDLRMTESGVQRITSLPIRDPKELIHLTVQEPAGSVLPGEEKEPTDRFTPLPDLDLDLEDFDFGDHDASSAHLDDDLIMPDSEPSTERNTKLAPASLGFSESEVSSLFDEVFEGSNDPTVADASRQDIPTPSVLKLPADPASYVNPGKNTGVVDLGVVDKDPAAAIVYDLLGESLILGRRGMRIDLRKARQNVALYDPSGKLEEERTIQESDLAEVTRRLMALHGVDQDHSGASKGFCRVQFEGEKARTLADFPALENPAQIVLVFLLLD